MGSHGGHAVLSLLSAQEFAEASFRVRDWAQLDRLMRQACASMGASHYALTHHVDFPVEATRGFRLHNYPEEWETRFDAGRLGTSDPIHRASQMTATGFNWRQVEHMIAMNRADEEVLREARSHGIGDGLTVPAHVPGEARGSISFAWRTGEEVPDDMLPYAQLVGSFAFEAARRLRRPIRLVARPKLSPRQRECIVWVARGKTDGEIAEILGISRETVIDYLRIARDQYEVSCRASLTARALTDGAICFADLE